MLLLFLGGAEGWRDVGAVDGQGSYARDSPFGSPVDDLSRRGHSSPGGLAAVRRALMLGGLVYREKILSLQGSLSQDDTE